MATAQKRGFHFPWGGDPHHDEPPPERADGEVDVMAALAERIGATADDLGAGPFGLSGRAPVAPAAEPAEGVVEPAEPVVELATEAAVAALDLDRAAWPESDRRTAGPLAGAPIRRREPPPTPDEAHAEPEAAAAEPEAVAAEEPAEAGSEASGTEAEATADAETLAAVAAEPSLPSPPAPATPRRANPLMAGLVRAMRDAARTARDETVAAFDVEASARADAVRAQAAVAVNDLKKVAEVDVAAIRDWSRAELARVRQETEARIAARRTQLVAETEAAGQATEDLLGSVHATVEAFKTEMARFFEALLVEEDPARLAGLAERMPVAPALDDFPTPAAEAEPSSKPSRVASKAPAAKAAARPAGNDTTVGPLTATDSPVTAEPEAAAAPEVMAEPEDVAEPADMAEPELEVPVAEAAASEPDSQWVADAADRPVEEAGAADRPAVEPEDPRVGWLDHLDPDAAAAAEAEALAGLDRQTSLIVSGLSSVAGIAGFKGELMHVEGVTAVSVTAGTNGDVLYTVTHDGQTELRDAVRGMETFETHLIADDGETLSIAAQEPAA